MFNIAVGLIAFLGGWWMKVMWQTLKDLQRADAKLADKVTSIEVLVAGQYIKRDDFEKVVDKVATEIFARLDKIDDKLDRKADKQ
jgi:hypothetical protein